MYQTTAGGAFAAKAAAASFKAAGGILYAVGVGSDVNTAVLHDMASTADDGMESRVLYYQEVIGGSGETDLGAESAS